MARFIEEYYPELKQDGLQTAKPVVLSGTSATLAVGGTLAVTGASTLTGVATFTAAPVFTLAPTFTGGIKRTVSIDASSATPTLGASGSVNIATKGSATQTYTLPAATTAGNYYTFVCGHASGEILINPASGEKIVGMTWAAIGADADTAQISNTTTGIKNTAATNVLGDTITLLADGVDTWFIVSMPTGIWASQ